MKDIIEKNNGVTLLALVITIVVLLIIAGITVYEGKETINRAKLEELRTNMLLIQAKSKEYVEEANFKIGKSTDKTKIAEIRKAIYETEAKLEPATGISTSSEIPVSECYKVTAEAMKQWGLDKVELKNKEYYLIKFDDSNATVEVYNTLGYNGRYSLTEIDNIEK